MRGGLQGSGSRRRAPEPQGRGSGYAGAWNPGRMRGKPERREGSQAGRADLIPGWRVCRCSSSGWGEGCATLSATRCSEARGLLLLTRRGPHSTRVCVVSRARRGAGTRSHLSPLSLRWAQSARCSHPAGPLCFGRLGWETGPEEKPTGLCSLWPPGSTWRGWVTRGASVRLALVWLRVCGC